MSWLRASRRLTGLHSIRGTAVVLSAVEMWDSWGLIVKVGGFGGKCEFAMLAPMQAVGLVVEGWGAWYKRLQGQPVWEELVQGHFDDIGCHCYGWLDYHWRTLQLVYACCQGVMVHYWWKCQSLCLMVIWCCCGSLGVNSWYVVCYDGLSTRLVGVEIIDERGTIGSESHHLIIFGDWWGLSQFDWAVQGVEQPEQPSWLETDVLFWGSSNTW